MSTRDLRDPELDRLYGDLDRVEPPPRLDAAILARARGAAQPDAPATASAASVARERNPRGDVDAHPSRAPQDGRRDGQMPGRRPADDDEPPSELWPLRDRPGPLMRWRVPIAVAATLAIAGSLVFLMQADDRTDVLIAPRESPVAGVPHAPATPSDAQGAGPGEDAARSDAGPAPSLPPSSRAADRSLDAAGPTSDSAVAGQKPQGPGRAAAAPGASQHANTSKDSSLPPRLAQEAPAAPSATARPPGARAGAPAPGSEGARKREAPATSPTPVESVDRSLLRGGRREGSTESTDTADELVERIRALRREGREEEARALLRALTERYPAFELPRDLRDLR
jgi:hypothetical protein